ncbi:putative FAD synthase [Botrytis cinerea]
MQDRDENHIEKQWQAACAERGDPDTDAVNNVGLGKREDGKGNGDGNGDIDQANNLLERCDEVARKVNGFLEEQFGEEEQVLRGVQKQTRIALRVIGECLERYSLEEISFSYNGGKDCLVLLILLLAALSNHQSSSSTSPSSKPTPKPLPLALPSVYILSPHPFPEVDTFVASSSAHYHLRLSRYASPMKEAFTQYLRDHPVVKAILVGTRRTDPHGADLTHFDLTDGGWPRFMRVHPVIDWHYREIWGFIRHLNIPYCPLYDQGYTSLGGTTDTHPNPVLVAENSQGEGEGEKKFRPAYELVEDEEERLGRDY